MKFQSRIRKFDNLIFIILITFKYLHKRFNSYILVKREQKELTRVDKPEFV